TTSTQLSTTVTNLRRTNIFDGQLYVSDASGSAIRLGTVGTGMPTTSGQTITNLPGFPMSGGSPYSFFFAYLSSMERGVDTLYYVDDGNSGGTQVGLDKWTLSGGVWSSSGTVAATTTRGLTGTVVGSTVTLYATNGSTLQTITDSS